jgi:hypothetical protein
MDSNHRYPVEETPLCGLPPFHPRNSPSATKTDFFATGTDGSNPSPSRRESRANLKTFVGKLLVGRRRRFGENHPLQRVSAARTGAGLSPGRCASRQGGVSFARDSPLEGDGFEPLGGIAIERVNQVWCSDVTYIPMARGFLYVVVIMDWVFRFARDSSLEGDGFEPSVPRRPDVRQRRRPVPG